MPFLLPNQQCQQALKAKKQTIAEILNLQKILLDNISAAYLWDLYID